MTNPFDEIVERLARLERLIERLIVDIQSEKESVKQNKLLSPSEACKLFNPNISKPTLTSYTNKGYLKKYYLEGRTWYKENEVIEALKSIKRYKI